MVEHTSCTASIRKVSRAALSVVALILLFGGTCYPAWHGREALATSETNVVLVLTVCVALCSVIAVRRVHKIFS